MPWDWSIYSLLLLFVQAFGVAATLMVRFHQGTEDETSYHGLFLVGLCLVGLAAATQFALRTSCFLSGLILALMILGVTCDFASRSTQTADAISGERHSG